MIQTYRAMPHRPALPPELVEILMQVETPTIGHVELVGFIGEAIRPVFPARAIGAAYPIAAPGRDGTIIYRAIDALQPGDILVISRVDRDDIACVGGGVALAAKAKGASAIIIDGPCTDQAEIAQVGLPVWCRGVSSKTTNRQLSIGGALNVPIACGGTAVLPGDAVIADEDGIFVADVRRMWDLARQAVERQNRSVAIRSHLAAGRSIFEYDQDQTS